MIMLHEHNTSLRNLCVLCASAVNVNRRDAENAEVAQTRKINTDSFYQQSTTERARPASLVSLYLLFISLAVWASAITVSSNPTRCRDAISLLAIAYAVQALTAPNAHRSMHGTCT